MIDRVVIIVNGKRMIHQHLHQVCEIDKQSTHRMYNSLCEAINTLYLLQSIGYSIIFTFYFVPSIPHISIVIEIHDILYQNSFCFKIAHLSSYYRKVSECVNDIRTSILL